MPSVLLYHVQLYPLETASITKLGQGWSLENPRNSVSDFNSIGVAGVGVQPGFYVGVRDLNSSPQSCQQVVFKTY